MALIQFESKPAEGFYRIPRQTSPAELDLKGRSGLR